MGSPSFPLQAGCAEELLPCSGAGLWSCSCTTSLMVTPHAPAKFVAWLSEQRLALSVQLS